MVLLEVCVCVCVCVYLYVCIPPVLTLFKLIVPQSRQAIDPI